MARVLVFTDRAPEDSHWKGALIWQIILSLAESQHEVLVATTLPAEHITLTHPRLTVTQPVKSWRADQALALTRLLFTYQPQVIQTFALAQSRLWPTLSVWPYVQGMCKMTPHIRRVSSLFDDDDCRRESAAFTWHQSADTVTVFSERQRAQMETSLRRRVLLVPMELTLARASAQALAHSSKAREVIVPAPISEWLEPERGLARLVRYCSEDQNRQVHIVGGWGDWTASQRKRGWIILSSIADRLHFEPEFSLADYTHAVRSATTLWIEPVAPNSWRFLMSTHLAQRFERKVILAGDWAPTVTMGSTANSLSRIYAETGLGQ